MWVGGADAGNGRAGHLMAATKEERDKGRACQVLASGLGLDFRSTSYVKGRNTGGQSGNVIGN